MGEVTSGYLEVLEEDDEFEEFLAEDWNEDEEEILDVNQWEDNWDDDNVEDDFSIQLRNILQTNDNRQ
ncbi:hypothetical protein ROZALSC1DRAFT_29497 [Rozella allomycis CSF55]|uniref:26S proteasome complex subunit SEM1 n=1 Tax=Rozella allomycis (strain CSF55) TaxID=988480 RepID=A0A075AYK1_ROZAC|nr:26S proteasome complex subunit DSS1 [Rozella allomycis CSF55]RKP18845.1 hypothetical protein ROZALSC1DRAFT_29497 [Rozella allomycis CSF55]|eukprot:EPZ33797.1 26S proteasome complex subunit DSS1 [Rozella allomycis CSF55]